MNDVQYAAWLGEVFDLERRSGSEAVLQRVRETLASDRDARVRMREGITLAKLARWQEALEVLQQIPDGLPFGHVGRAWRANALMVLGRLDEALVQGERAARGTPPLAEVKTVYAEILYRAGRLSDALDVLRAANDEFPDEPWPAALLSKYLTWNGDPVQGERIARERLARVEDAALHGSLGEALIGQKRFAEALAEYETAKRFAPDVAEWSRLRAHCLVELGRADEAVAEVRAQMAKHPGSVEHVLNFALVASNYADPAAVVDELKALATKFPRNAEIGACVATAYERAGDSDAADRVLAKYVEQTDLPDWVAELARSRGLL